MLFADVMNQLSDGLMMPRDEDIFQGLKVLDGFAWHALLSLS